MADAIDSIALENPTYKVDFVKDRGSQPMKDTLVKETEMERHTRIKLAELAKMNIRPTNSNTDSSNLSEQEKSA